jgi:hypothetical protein
MMMGSLAMLDDVTHAPKMFRLRRPAAIPTGTISASRLKRGDVEMAGAGFENT